MKNKESMPTVNETASNLYLPTNTDTMSVCGGGGGWILKLSECIQNF